MRHFESAGNIGSTLPVSRHYVVVLIHGTWAKDAAWTADRSSLRAYLTKTLSGTIEFVVFPWSGKNSISARQRAAKDLQAFLHDLQLKFPDSQHYIVAHSHGGNIALYALKDPFLAANVVGLACLSTPFLHARRRNLGAYGSTILLYFGIVIYGGFLYFGLNALFEVVLPPLPSSDVTQVFRFALSFICILPMIAFMGWIIRTANKLEHTLEVPVLKWHQLLIVRGPGDEASCALSTSQFVSWAATRFWTGLTIPLANSEKIVDWLDELQWKCHPTQIWTLVVSIILAVAFSVSERFVVLAVVSSVIAGISAIVWLGAAVIRGISNIYSLLVGAVAVPAVLVTALMALPFGYELAIASILLELTSESTPPGSWNITQLSGYQPDGEGGSMRLSHSTYEDPEAWQKLAQWIERNHSDHRDSVSAKHKRGNIHV